MTNSDVCTVCHRPAEGHNARHPFIGPKDSLNAGTTGWLKPKDPDPVVLSPTGNTSSPVIQTSSLPFDPVLRTALLKKGVLTMADLEEADAFIRAVGGALNGDQKPV